MNDDNRLPSIAQAPVFMIVGFLTLVGAGPALAQIDAGGRTALENVTAGQLAARAPGNLVSAGIARAQNRISLGVIGVDITETEGSSPRGEALAEALEVIFEEWNAALTFFSQVFLARLGFTSDVASLINLASKSTEVNEEPASMDDFQAVDSPGADQLEPAKGSRPMRR